jgi:mono/diheme cytochrome c family protein
MAPRKPLRAVIACAALLASCAHGGAARSSEPKSARAPNAPSKAAPRKSAAPPTGRIEDYMLDHYVIVTFSRDAVIAGSLEGLRMPLRAFAAHRYDDVAGTAWMPWLEQLQEQAKLTASSASLELAAAGVATMARTCGDCHRASGRGPRLDERAIAPREHRGFSSSPLQKRMSQHMWAAEQLWDGLVVPSDAAWEAGASALAHLATDTPQDDPPLSPAFASALLDVRALGERAQGVSTQADRASVYGLLLASCAGCHAQLEPND